MKRGTPVLCLIAFLLLSTLQATPVPAADRRGNVAAHPESVEPALSGAALTTGQLQAPRERGGGQAVAPEVDTTLTSHFLPLVLNNQKNARPCSEDSPFSVQIAALHMVEEELAALGMTEEEWQAWYDAAFPTLVDALKASGACWTRLRVDWGRIQPDPPPAPYIWAPYHDEKLGLVAASGVHIIGVVDGPPDWAAASGVGPVYPEHFGDLAQFLTDMVNRYKEPPYNIHVWELFNEPDLRSADGTWGWGLFGQRYAEMLPIATAAIKAADPEATVLMGGIAYDWFSEYGGPFNRYYPDDVMAAGGAQFFDAFNLHYFPDFALEWERWQSSPVPPTCGIVDDGVGAAYEAPGIDIIAKINHFQNRMATCFGASRPMWITELAEHGVPGDSLMLDQQARYVIQGYTRALAAGAVNVTWFALVSPKVDPFNQGLLTSYLDFTPKPAFYSYQTLTQELGGYSYLNTLNTPGVEAYVFADDAGHTKIVAWTWGDPLQPGYLTLPGTSPVRQADRNRNVTYVEDGGAGDADGAVNGSILIALPAPPVDPDPTDSYRLTSEPLFLSQ